MSRKGKKKKRHHLSNLDYFEHNPSASSIDEPSRTSLPRVVFGSANLSLYELNLVCADRHDNSCCGEENNKMSHL